GLLVLRGPVPGGLPRTTQARSARQCRTGILRLARFRPVLRWCRGRCGPGRDGVCMGTEVGGVRLRSDAPVVAWSRDAMVPAGAVGRAWRPPGRRPRQLPPPVPRHLGDRAGRGGTVLAPGAGRP